MAKVYLIEWWKAIYLGIWLEIKAETCDGMHESIINSIIKHGTSI